MNKAATMAGAKAAPDMRRTFRLLREKPCRSNLLLNAAQRTVIKGGVSISLTGKEFQILRYLLLHPGRAVGIQELYEQIWQEIYLPSSANTVMVHILNLRRKVEDDPAHPALIRTIWGKGYMLSQQAAAV